MTARTAAKTARPAAAVGRKTSHGAAGTRNVLLVVAYDGTDFSGWQRLGGGARTVQKTLEDALASVLGHPVNVIGAGRTDAGVHADGQAANFHTGSRLSAEAIAERLDAALPRDLSVVEARDAQAEFHARYRAVAKTYSYRFHDGGRRDPFSARYSLRVPGRLDEAAIRAALSALPGERDFSAFSNAKDDARGFVRNLSSAGADRRGDEVEVWFRADGFLYNQARIMAACALEAGLGRLAAAGVRAMLESRDRAAAPGALGAFGLRLRSVEYRPSDFDAV